MGLRVTRHAVARWREHVGHGDLVEALPRALLIPRALDELLFRRGRRSRVRRLLFVDEPAAVLVEVEGAIVTTLAPGQPQLIALRRWAAQLEAA